MLRIDKQPVVATVRKLLYQRRAMGVDKQSHLRSSCAQLCLELSAAQSGFGHVPSSLLPFGLCSLQDAEEIQPACSELFSFSCDPGILSLECYRSYWCPVLDIVSQRRL